MNLQEHKLLILMFMLMETMAVIMRSHGLRK
jgi:hypothetical protein